MQKIYRAMLVALLFGLVILGLNTSNQGINRLTMENRGPVMGLNIDSKDINVQFLSENYAIPRDKLLVDKEEMKNGLQVVIERVKNHFIKIWVIFKAVFL
ncbi:MAG: hypothetical protein ABFD08_03890 [Syntrophomonas sp.]